MRDWNTPPREVLPPNTKVECFDNRVVTMHWDCSHLAKSYLVAWGNLTRWEDDPDEAQAASERGAEYVRTGVMP